MNGGASGARRRGRPAWPGNAVSVLVARGISVSFGGVHAVVDVDLDVGPGELVGLIGPNGAGKTTFIDAITGFVPHLGTVAIDGADVTGQRAHARARRGMARTWQAIELFDDLTVRENLTVAAVHPTAWTTVKEVLAPTVPHSDSIDEALAVFDLGGFADATPSELSQGQRKLVAVARALAARPSCCASTSPPPGSTPTSRWPSGAGCARSSTVARRPCSSTTTWDSCSAFATGSS